MILGLTQRVFYHNGQAYDATDRNWYRFFHDFQLTTIRNTTGQNFETIANKLDALIITGGNDPMERRVVETTLARHMLLQDKPIIGICHGAFLLTELLYGVVGEIDGHHNTTHTIFTEDGEKTVNSFHSLCIRQNPRGSKVLAVDEDGNIESWIDKKIAAIVWHPERMEKPYVPGPILDLISSSR